jgi:hypothetical protein
MKICSCLLLTAAVWLGTPAVASPLSTLYLGASVSDGSGNVVNVTQSNTSATASTVLSGSVATPYCGYDNCGTSLYGGSNVFGTITSFVSGQAFCTAPVYIGCTGARTSSDYQSYSWDGVQIGTIAGGSGLLELQYIMQGVLDSGGNSDATVEGFFGDSANSETVFIKVEFEDCPLGPYTCNTIDGGHGVPIGSGVDYNGSTSVFTFTKELFPNGDWDGNWDYTVYGTVIIPVSSNSSDALFMQITGGGAATGGGSFYSAYVDPQIGGAQFYDPTGTTLLTGVTLTSTSGFDYTLQIPPTGTPEPSTFYLLGVGVVGIWFGRKRTGGERI